MFTKSIKKSHLIGWSLCLGLLACGDSWTGQEWNETSLPLNDTTSVSREVTPVSENHCSEKAPLDEFPQTYCKTLEDGSVFSVTLKPSTYVQDPDSCVVTVVDDGMKTTILEMGFDLCEASAT